MQVRGRNAFLRVETRGGRSGDVRTGREGPDATIVLWVPQFKQMACSSYQPSLTCLACLVLPTAHNTGSWSSRSYVGRLVARPLKAAGHKALLQKTYKLQAVGYSPSTNCSAPVVPWV